MLNSITVKHSTEGPAHDPYAVTYINFVDLHRNRFTLELGMGEQFFVGSELIVDYSAPAGDAIKAFEEHLGISVTQVMRIYDKLNPYFEDPMGNPSSYM